MVERMDDAEGRSMECMSLGADIVALFLWFLVERIGKSGERRRETRAGEWRMLRRRDDE